MRFLINKEDQHQISLAKALGKSKPGSLILCSKEEIEAFNKIIMINGPEISQDLEWFKDKIHEILIMINTLIDRIEIIEKNINVPEEVTQADIDALTEDE